MKDQRNPSRRRQTLSECQAGDRSGAHAVVLSESQFRASLRRERRRAERSERPFVLMLASMENIPDGNNRAGSMASLAAVIAAGCRETDIAGWHQNEVLGVVFTELGQNDRAAVLASLQQKMSALIQQRLSAKDARQVYLSFHFFPEDFGPEDPTILRDREELYGPVEPKRVARAVKRVIDVVGSSVGLVVLSPLLLAISIIIKLTSKGPVLFRHPRVGQHGKEFIFLKFRSMYADNDAATHRNYIVDFIAGRAPLLTSADGKVTAYKVLDDPRITPFGRFLRKSSLDELPQLFNVLKGEISLVGSRPPIPYELACYHSWHLRRISEVKPGITGLWQVCGRSKTSFDDMVRLDLRYAMNWSLWLDFIILLKTPRVVLNREGAH